MARGWESKSVEAQIEESAAAGDVRGNAALTSEQVEQRRRKSDLMLSRSRVVQQLEQSTNERYAELLRRTLADLDKQIGGL
jgi:hypothetical protein